MKGQLKYGILAFLGAAVTAACSLVDENLSDCETDYHLDYELRLVTNLTTELEAELSAATDVSVVQSLETYLGGIFSSHAHDVDLSFYDVEGDLARLHHESHIMDAEQSSYTLYIPVRKYMHLAVANLADSPELSLQGDGFCGTARIAQQVQDTISSHRSGLFTARLPMDIQEGVDQQFDVRLYMANCSASLVIDTLGSHVKDLKVFMTGFATGFDIRDSLYRYDYTPVVKADEVPLEEKGQVCFTAVTFPSRTVATKAEAESLWRITAYATLPDGSITQTILGVPDPLPAGHLRVFKAKARENGQVAPGDPSMAVSVTMDWTPGIDSEIIL